MSSLNSEQKQAIALLSVGTFLEYFDLMLYVHMAVLLNDLFFPKTDPHTASLLSAFAFCSTYLLRPFGALLLGYIGDNIGRKATVIITTITLSVSCLIMANLPTYEQFGITAAVIVILCRIVQGISSMGERVGAELYLTEFIKLPERYPAVALIWVGARLGLTFALAVASLSTSYGFNWRIAFWIGAGIALIGSVARTALRETPDFADAKRRVMSTMQESKIDQNSTKQNLIFQEKVNIKTAISYFLIQLAQPVWFYFVYIHCSNLLKNSFDCNPEQIIHQSLIVSIIELIVSLGLAFLSYKIYPLKILKIKSIIFFSFLLIFPLLLNNIHTYSGIFMIQAFIVIFSPSEFPAIPIFYKTFPVFKRFTYVSFIYATSRAAMCVISSFGLVYLTEYFNNWGLLIIMVPVAIGYSLGVSHFINLERKAENSYQLY